MSINPQNSKNLFVVLNVKTASRKSIYYKAIPINFKESNKWSSFQKVIELPEFVAENDEFKLYMFNPENGNFLIRNLLIKKRSLSKKLSFLILINIQKC
jgi:hypothetical protein